VANNAKDNTVLERIKMLKENSTKDDWWSEISEEEKSSIEKGLADIKAGRVKPHKDVRKLYEKWL
jgi:predicted transcriptional regulator